MLKDSYFTIKGEGQGTVKELGSKFIAFAVPVNSESSVLDFLKKIQRKYHDSTHICYAYILGKDNPIFRTHDAGEPKHSAGTPIMNQIRSMEVTDVLVVVVRYFGGTKLGISGLGIAYRKAAQLALDQAGRVEKTASKNLIIHFEPTTTGAIMKILHASKSWIAGYKFETAGTLNVQVLESKVSGFLKLLQAIPGASASSEPI